MHSSAWITDGRIVSLARIKYAGHAGWPAYISRWESWPAYIWPAYLWWKSLIDNIFHIKFASKTFRNKVNSVVGTKNTKKIACGAPNQFYPSYSYLGPHKLSGGILARLFLTRGNYATDVCKIAFSTNFRAFGRLKCPPDVPEKNSKLRFSSSSR